MKKQRKSSLFQWLTCCTMGMVIASIMMHTDIATAQSANAANSVLVNDTTAQPNSAPTVKRDKLTIHITNIPTQKGRILVSIDKGKKIKMAKPKGSTVTIDAGKMKNGEHIMAVLHDTNNNFKPDMKNNIPQEYCTIHRFTLTDEITELTVRLQSGQEAYDDAMKLGLKEQPW